MIFELNNYMFNFLELVFKNIFQILTCSDTINIMKRSCQHFGYFVRLCQQYRWNGVQIYT